MTRVHALVVCVAFAAGALAGGCAERQADLDEDSPDLLPACMVLPARGYFEDGTSKHLLDEDMSSGSVCMCMTLDELNNSVYVDELNERALAECFRISTLYYDFDWTNCQESYEEGEWLNIVSFAIGDYESFNDEGLTCGDEDVLGCSLGERGAVPPGWGLVLLAALSLLHWRERA